MFSPMRFACLAAALLLPALSPAQDSGADTDPAKPAALAGGPNDVREIIRSNDRTKESLFALPQVDDAITPWLNFKQRLNEDYGFKLGTDYQVLYQEASDSLGEDEAAGGAYRLFFDWTLFGRGSSNPGSIIFKTEQRHNLWTDVAPEGLGGELGYAGLTGTGYGDFNWGVTDFFWKQQFLAGNGVEIRLGRLAPTAYFDVTLHSDPYTNFTNFSLNFTPTVAYPADGSLGGVLWGWDYGKDLHSRYRPRRELADHGLWL